MSARAMGGSGLARHLASTPALHHGEKAPEVPRDQRLGRRLVLVGEHAEHRPCLLHPLQGRDHAGIGRGVVFLVECVVGAELPVDLVD